MDTISQPVHPGCQYHYDVNEDIHVITYTEATPRAVDGVMRTLLNLHAEGRSHADAEHKIQRVLIINDHTALPTQYIFTKAQSLVPLLHDHPYCDVRIAALARNVMTGRLIQLFMQTLPLPRFSYRSFPIDNREAALAWLLA